MIARELIRRRPEWSDCIETRVQRALNAIEAAS